MKVELIQLEWRLCSKMDEGIYKTNVSQASPVFIPLSDPAEKFGDIFKIDKPYLENGLEKAEVIQVEDDEPQNKFSIQDYDGLALSLNWGVYSPRKKNVINDTRAIENHPFIDSFTVTKKRCTKDEADRPNKNIGAAVETFSGINKNLLKINLEKNIDRYLNLDIQITDVFDNVHTGNLVVRNYPAEATINNIYKSGGFAHVEYTGTPDLLGINLYGFTGSNIYGKLEDSDEFKSTSKILTLNENNVGKIPLYPRRRFHILACPYDSAGESDAISLRDGVDPTSPSGFFFTPSHSGISVVKIKGGLQYEMNYEYDWHENPFVDIKYNIIPTGDISEPVYGYDGLIYYDSSMLADEVSTDSINPKQVIFDNQMNWQNETKTGELKEEDGEVFGAGAGDKWDGGSPRYSGANGVYKYAYIDTDTCKIKCVTMEEIESGLCPVEGAFSLPINDPNSSDIAFRSGPNFSNKYERAATYLKEINEMPAVILNKSQLNKIKNYESVKGWIGLRREDVGCLDNLFSTQLQNDLFFNEVDFQSGNYSGYLDKDGDRRFFKQNNVGEHWAWVNSSGDHIYKYAGNSGYYNEGGQVTVVTEYINDRKQKISTETQRVDFYRPKMIDVERQGEGEDNLVITYNLENSNYSGNVANPEITQVNVYTGDTADYDLSPDNLFWVSKPVTTSGDIASQAGIESLQSTTTIKGVDSTIKNIKVVPADYLGEGSVFNLSENFGDFKVFKTSQVISYDLDPHFEDQTQMIEVNFETPTKNPTVTFGVSTKNKEDPPQFLTAMMVGDPEEDSVTFLLNQAPPLTGYFIDLTVTAGDDSDD